MMFGISRRTRIGASALAIALSLAAAAAAQAQERAYSRPAEPLSVRLREFARVSGEQIVFTDDLVRGRTAPALQGSFSAEDALGRILAGTGLVARRSESGALMIVRADAPQAPAALNGGATQVDEVVVTGTRIRGGTTPSPVISITTEQIRDEGLTDLGAVVRNLPQNFSGGQNPGIVRGASAGGVANQNVTGGSGVNLRGLGQDATLTLLNGRRMAYGGYIQMVDISAIPLEAVARIEIVPDGASAIYGSDAVGGVANVILKREFDGATLGTRHGYATDGGLETHEYTATLGARWSTGGLIATWKDSSNDPIYSDQREYAEAMYRPATLWQGSDLQSGLVSLHQGIGSRFEVQVDALRSDRATTTQIGYGTLSYNYYPHTVTTLVSASVAADLPGDWAASASATFGEDETRYSQPAISTSGAVLTQSEGVYDNGSRAYEVGAEGPVFSLPGGAARVAVGAGFRHNDLLYLNTLTNVTYTDDGEDGRFAYAELNLPFVGPQQGVAGVRRLEMTAAVRAEDYDSYGDVVTPKIGIIYSPNANFTLRSSWGESFKAPTLMQRHFIEGVYLYPVETFGGTSYPAGSTGLFRRGGNPDLKPERAESWSATLAFHPEPLPSLQMELSWFDVDYQDRIVEPVVATQALSNPIYAEFNLFAPSEALQAGILAGAGVFGNYAGAAYDPSRVVVIVDNRYFNSLSQRARGVDLSGSYNFNLQGGRVTVRGAGSWLETSQATTATQAPYDLSGTLFYPAKFSGRLGAVYNRDGFTGSVFGNYKSGVLNTANGVRGDSFLTIDATLRYDTGDGGRWTSGLSFELSAQNLFDEPPPLYATTDLSQAPYDSTNYSAIGRFVSLSVSKRF